jgi:hypothetical protein
MRRSWAKYPFSSKDVAVGFPENYIFERFYSPTLLKARSKPLRRIFNRPNLRDYAASDSGQHPALSNARNSKLARRQIMDLEDEILKIDAR